MTPRRVYVLLGGLWVGQWLAPSFLGMGGLTTILYQQGVSLERLGAFQALTLIGLAKFLWAPLVDRFGSYRSWLLVAQPAMVLAVVALIPLDPVDDLAGVTAIVIGMWVLMGTQDVATDALSVRLLDATGRGVANGIQTAAGFVGTVLGSGAVLLVYDRLGWIPALLMLAVATALPVAQVLRFREPPTAPREHAGFGSLVSLLRQPGVARWALALLPLMWAGIGGCFALLSPMLVDAGWPLARIGLVVTVLGSLAAIAGGLAAGPLTARIGRRRGLLLFGTAQLVAVLGLFVPAFGHADPLAVSVVICLVHVTYAAAVTAASTVSMDLCRPASAGSDYTALSTVGTAVSLGVGAVVTTLAGTYGYAPLLAASVVLLAAGVLAAALFLPADHRRGSDHGLTHRPAEPPPPMPRQKAN